MYDNLVYTGWVEPRQFMDETGDSSRDFIVQRYVSHNSISINEIGNRIACHHPTEKSNSVLMLGDSQLFGSGLSDVDTLPVQLCKAFDVSIYNGARKNGLDLLRIKGMGFSKIIFTSTERFGFLSQCEALKTFRDVANNPVEKAQFKTKISVMDLLKKTNKFVSGYLKQRLQALLKITQPLEAPSAHLIKHEHTQPVDVETNELKCIVELNNFFHNRNMIVGFLYFPSHQTIYGNDVSLETPESTLNFIPNMVKKMQAVGVNTFDTKACLMKAKDRVEVNQLHDTHLSREGFSALVECLRSSGFRDALM